MNIKLFLSGFAKGLGLRKEKPTVIIPSIPKSQEERGEDIGRAIIKSLKFIIRNLYTLIIEGFKKLKERNARKRKEVNTKPQERQQASGIERFRIISNSTYEKIKEDKR